MPPDTPELYTLQRKDMPKAGAVLADAFRHDPLWNRVFEGLSNAERRRQAFFETPVRYCRKFGEVCAPSRRLEGIAAWVPGELADMTFLRMLRSGAMGSAIRMGSTVAKRIEPVFGPLQRDRRQNMGNRPFIYIMIVGVAPEHQRRGHGRRLLRALIQKCERDRIALYLETETEQNAAMYERYGFRLIKKITLPVVHLPMWEMVRECMT